MCVEGDLWIMQTLKSLILGLDGGTWDVLLPLIDLGVMPNLGRLVERGARGILTSCFPPITGPAWTTFATGKNPGHHGFFDWGVLDRQYNLRMWSNAEVPDQTLWSRLSDAGRRVGVFDVPFSYPPDPVNGFVVCSVGTPSPASPWCYPPELKPEIEARLGEYNKLNIQLTEYGPDEYRQLIDEQIGMEARRTDVLLWLLDRYTLDDLIVVFTGPDRISHFLGHGIHTASDAQLPSLTPEQAEVIRYFRALDEQIGRVLAWVGPDTQLAVVSDHGFCAKDKVFYVNEWLHWHGYLAVTPSSWLKSRLVYLSGAISQPRKVVLRDEDASVAEIVRENRFNTGLHLGQQIVWSRTRAFSNAHNAIYINTSGRFAHGTVQPGAEYERLVERLIAELLAVKDPETGQPVFEGVYRREQVYSGPWLEEAPDLLLRFRDDRYTSNRYFFGPEEWRLRIGRSAFVRPPHWSRGDHHFNGIVLFAGPAFRSGAMIASTSIENVAPTMLHALGLPVPTGMTGQVVQEVLVDAHRAANSVRKVDDPALKQSAAAHSGLSAHEEQLIIEQLRDLGYLE